MITRENKPDFIPSDKASSEYHCDDPKDYYDDKSAKEIANLKEACNKLDMRIKALENKKQPTSIFDAFIKHPKLITAIMICICIAGVVFICWEKRDIIHYIDRSIDSLRCICYSKK